MIYLAGPIDGIDAKEAKTWREKANEALTAHDLATFSPAHAFAVGDTDSETATAIININNYALSKSRAVLANLGGISFGTPIEVWDAVTHYDMPVFSFGLSSRSIYRHRVRNFAKMDHALEALVEEMIHGRG